MVSRRPLGNSVKAHKSDHTPRPGRGEIGETGAGFLEEVSHESSSVPLDPSVKKQ